MPAGPDAAPGKGTGRRNDQDLPQAAQGGERVGQPTDCGGDEASVREQRLDETLRSEFHVGPLTLPTRIENGSEVGHELQGFCTRSTMSNAHGA